jgi:flagellar biosynthetic protein FliP
MSGETEQNKTPATISLPIKLLMFVLIDGWALVIQGVVGGFG